MAEAEFRISAHTHCAYDVSGKYHLSETMTSVKQFPGHRIEIIFTMLLCHMTKPNIY